MSRQEAESQPHILWKVSSGPNQTGRTGNFWKQRGPMAFELRGGEPELFAKGKASTRCEDLP